MLGTQNLPLFIASGLLLNLIPGPDTLYIVGRSISQGRKAGVVSVLGISSGRAVHIMAAFWDRPAAKTTLQPRLLRPAWESTGVTPRWIDSRCCE